ncbi:TetR/AcrR family transcriptional regulator [Clostridium tunisiense]|uniref:TetR/AcrR family transcriptional regulator n=1 Tax=Clostridium tunisiense TaxID=219748 RepID=UPI00031AC8A7|nr:TetR/AcrR family transcriptional regulator [Clostridium tunisiense]
MNGFQRRREKKMDDIITAACELFSANGIKVVSIAEIAKKANVSQVSIYNFFESKENLAKQAYFKIMDEIMKDLEALIKSNISFREKFEKMVHISLESAKNLDGNLSYSELLKDPTVQKFLEEYGHNKTIPLLMDLIEQGKSEGCLDREISSESILIYINSYNEMLKSNMSTKTRIDLGKLFFYGLFGENNS